MRDNENEKLSDKQGEEDGSWLPEYTENSSRISEDASRSSSSAARKSRKRLKTEDEVALEEVEPDTKRRRRAWELWSSADKHVFFAALNLYGKDFDKIQDYFKNKLKNKQGVPIEFIKNKNQIRHFYYRTWHKLTPYITFDKELKASTKELFALINYGEIWKRIEGVVVSKNLVKLNELVHKGSVTIKHKGKTFRVKTPVCPVLKRIHNKQDTEKKKCLPTRVTIELRPRTTTDWIRVHKMAQNPYIKVTLGVQRRLASLLKCLKSKWRSRESKLLEHIQSRDRDGTTAHILDNEVDIILMPARGAEIKLPVIVPEPTITSSQISLQCMKEELTTSTTNSENKIKIKCDTEDNKVCKDNNDQCSDDKTNATNEDDQEGIDVGGDTLGQVDLASDDLPDVGEDGDDFIPEDWDGENSHSPVPAPDQGDKDCDFKFEEDRDRDEGKDEVDGHNKSDKLIHLKSNLSNLKNFDPNQGWNTERCGDTTIGELFLMLSQGNNTSVILEYEWKEIVPKTEAKESETKEKAKTNTKDAISCEVGGVLSKLVKLSSTQNLRGRGRQNSLTLSSPNIRSAQSPNSPSVAGKPKSSQVSRGAGAANTSRGGANSSRGGVVKKLPLISETMSDRQDGPLAVPLQEHDEFRKPIAPAPAVKPAPLNSIFHQQIGQYFPKFSNRRGRQNRSRLNNKLVGRQTVKPIRSSLMKPIQTISVPNTFNNQNMIINPPSPFIISSGGLPTTATTLLLAPVQPPQQPKSPPLLHIPSPAMSPAPDHMESVLSADNVGPRTPSPSPSLMDCSLMDISFPDSTPVTPHKADQWLMDDNSLLNTPMRVTSPPSSEVNLSEDISLTPWNLNFESPLKHSQIFNHNEDSQTSIISTSSEVDRQFSAMMNENSIDFTSKFRQLAKHVTSDKDLSHSS